MQSRQKRWEVSPRAPESHFEKFPDVQKLVVQILYNRGFTDPQEIYPFLRHQWDGGDPYVLQGMSEAVERILWAIKHQELIAIYGDYDADGVTSTALMIDLLSQLGAKVRPYIPDRFDEGYGLNNEAISLLASQGVKVMLTVDCGIRSVDEVKHANSLDLDVIITDHHSVGDEIPPALATINPKQDACIYPFKELAGVGLAYKFAQALLSSGAPEVQLNGSTPQANDLLDLVALGTVADLAPLYGENRKLVAQGLELLNHRPLRPGLAALKTKIGLRKAITAGTIGFMLGPRLNAAGRLDNALAAFDLLMVQNELEAAHLANWLDQQNQERQALTMRMVSMAREDVLATQADQLLYFVRHPEFNPGVVGLAASRLTEEFYRPSLVAEQGDEKTKGSARSIPEFHITAALEKCADLLLRYGGHAAAAGFTLKNENVPAFMDRLQNIAKDELTNLDLRPTISIDGELNLRGVRDSLVEDIQALQPFGYGNTTPCFVSRNLSIKSKRTVGQEQQHLKLNLDDGKQPWGAIGFRQGDWAEKLGVGDKIDVVYNLEFNEWNGSRQMQLNIKDLRPSEG